MSAMSPLQGGELQELQELINLHGQITTELHKRKGVLLRVDNDRVTCEYKGGFFNRIARFFANIPDYVQGKRPYDIMQVHDCLKRKFQALQNQKISKEDCDNLGGIVHVLNTIRDHVA